MQVARLVSSWQEGLMRAKMIGFAEEGRVRVATMAGVREGGMLMRMRLSAATSAADERALRAMLGRGERARGRELQAGRNSSMLK